MFVFPPLKQAVGAADSHTLRNHNTSIIANLAWQQREGISRADLARSSGLSTSTVWTIVSDLVEAGLLESSHVARSKGGRPPVVLRFNAMANHVIGVEMGSSHLTATLCNLRGEVLWHVSEEQCDVPNDPRGTLQVMEELVGLCRRRPEAQGALLGVGVAVPCPVDALTPDRLSPRLLPNWADIRVASQLSERFGVRVFVDNDANCGTLAEALLGAARDVSDFTYIKVATGCGAGFMVQGELYRGYSGIAGEIGHSSVDPNGRLCRCGLQGCLEAEIGSRELVAKAKEAIAEGRASVLEGQDELRLKDIVAAAKVGDELALELAAEAGRHLGLAVANLLNFLNPARVIIGGLLSTVGGPLLVPLRRTVRERALSTSVEHAEIVTSTLAPEYIAAGAATMVLRAALDDLSLFQAPEEPHADSAVSTTTAVSKRLRRKSGT